MNRSSKLEETNLKNEPFVEDIGQLILKMNRLSKILKTNLQDEPFVKDWGHYLSMDRL